MRAEQVTAAAAHHGEGAFWDDRDERLRFVDLLAGDVLTLLPTGTLTRRHLGDTAAVIRGREAGGWVVALERSFALLDADWQVDRVVPAFASTRLRLNEGGVDPQGRLLCGSMAYDFAPGAGVLHRLDPDGSVHDVLRHATIPNGLVWSADGSTAFHNDTGPATLTAYDWDAEAGLLVEPRPIVRFDPHDGAPDGMAIDVDGGLWVAMWGGGSVRRYDPSGRLDAIVDVPGATNTTSCAFGGADRRTLFITTSREGLAPGAEPASGSIFAVDAGIAGAPVGRFIG
ncbi:SMP-30/gluconolactonase/LRE family protein [Agromyces sp. MMS24-JH15]|uniref:SMP-30/gluconolactonase/LRE family protein n=1 Tax=Agromyces sp. MMS24-JH15 TaxID=3243765 RepID=UPI00374999C1